MVKKYIDQLINWQILPFQLDRVVHDCVDKIFASYCNIIRHNVAVTRHIPKFMPTEGFFLSFDENPVENVLIPTYPHPKNLCSRGREDDGSGLWPINHSNQQQ